MSKGSGGSTQQVQRVEPSTLQAPYISDALRQSQDLYNLGPQQFFLVQHLLEQEKIHKQQKNY